MIDIPERNSDFSSRAGIDVGTNTVRLLVVGGKAPSSFTVLEQSQRITRLGEGMDRRLQQEPMKRTVAVIVDFVRRARQLQAAPIAIVATSAARRAENGAEFCRRVRQATGIWPEIVSGTKEAELTLRGVQLAVPVAGKDAVILDVGGGSTELIRVDGGKVTDIKSLEIGAVTLTERFLYTAGPIPDAELDQLRKYAKKIMEGLDFPSDSTWVGTAGTITTLAAMDQQMVQYNPERINGFILSCERVSYWLELLAQMPLQERQGLPGLEPKRADIIVAGAGLLEVVMERFNLEFTLVSDAGFREGMVYNLIDGEKI